MRTSLGMSFAVIAIAVSGLAAPLVLLGMQDRRNEPRHLHLFFSPEAPPSEKTITRLRRIQANHSSMEIDHHLLVRDFRGLSTVPSQGFKTAITTLRDGVGPDFGLSIFDEEGLRLAARYGLTGLPAAVLEQGGRAHIAYGSDPNLEELLKCRK